MLFLVDRRALAAQAVRAFGASRPSQVSSSTRSIGLQPALPAGRHGEDEKLDPKVFRTAYLTNPKPGDAFVYVSTIQRMSINLFGRGALSRRWAARDDASSRYSHPRIRHGHRRRVSPRLLGPGASVWRKTLDHFDAIKIGLTATPAAHTQGVVQRRGLSLQVRAGSP